MITLCTLFNSNYIDKGLTMYESIERYTQDFILYVLCMDDECYDVLTDLSLPRFIPIKLSDYETPELLRLKEERTMGEYCWTNSSCFTSYILEKFNPEYCAYIDSDLYFYSDVNVVVKEMELRSASVMVVGHRFNWYDRKEREFRVGKYCVEFNTFKNDEKGRKLLNIWKKQCIGYCRCDGDGVHWADQKYLDNWCRDYTFCVETKNFGAGVAPWNIAQYRLVEADSNGPKTVRCGRTKYSMLFYHFQSLTFINQHTANTGVFSSWGISCKLVESFYIPYLKHISRNKETLKTKYDIDVLIRRHPGIKDSGGIEWYERLNYKNFRDLLIHGIPRKIYERYNILEF